MTDLDRLIEAVEAGHGATWFTIGQAISRPASSSEVKWVQEAADGSLDAAKRLHDALLPERYGVAFQYSKQYKAKTVIIDPMDGQQWDSGNAWIDPARAWLLAILRAVKAREGK